MKSTIIASKKRRKQIGRPFGESITRINVDAYIKIHNKENSRKKDQRKINEKKKQQN